MCYEIAALYANLPPEDRAKIDALIYKLLVEQRRRGKEAAVMNPEQVTILAYAAARSARELFPEWFAEKSDQEIINEIAAAVQRAGEKVPG